MKYAITTAVLALLSLTLAACGDASGWFIVAAVVVGLPAVYTAELTARYEA